MICLRPLLILCCLLLAPFSGRADGVRPHAEAPAIRVNQVGYLPNMPKLAVLMGAPASGTIPKITLIDAITEVPLLSFKPGSSYADSQGKQALRLLDFSSVTKPGRYVLSWQGTRSPEFSINEKVFTETLTLLLRSYTLQRCGEALDDALTGLAHGPCHTRDGTLSHGDIVSSMGTHIDARGGWHDAGDFGKYVATTAITVGRLLACWKQHPEGLKAISLSLPTPRHPNECCDTLAEIRVGITWMLRMQRNDGALYRKLSGKSWPKPSSPDEDQQPRFVYGISTPETAKAAAVFAMAARAYAPTDPLFARQCLTAARRAWSFLESTPEMQVDQRAGDDAGSGAYVYSATDREPTLTTDIDDRFWAAAELFITTKEAPFLAEVKRILPLLPWGLFEWKDPSALGMANLLSHATGEVNLADALQKKVLQRADTLLKNIRKSPWLMANTRLVWGSNKMAAEEGITLGIAHGLTGNPAYLSGAVSQLNFLLGTNPMGICFVTGVGSHPVGHVNHLFARAVGKDIPGLLVGGPNKNAEDGIAPKEKGLLSYIDDNRSYATNEYAIDYNAAIIGLIIQLTTPKVGREP